MFHKLLSYITVASNSNTKIIEKVKIEENMDEKDFRKNFSFKLSVYS